MTAAVYRTTQPSLSVPHTQNTAPALEFNCLYTHDIRRKQKRWQDGFLRFHTFNKRVMVYDVPRNFIGDTHWKADEAVQDGDEVTLEKDGVLVQVAESVGRTETDLTELRRSKNRGSSEQGSSPAKGAQTPAAQNASATAQKQSTQLKHRSLNALLGATNGPLGKAALPTKSPFEERLANDENEEWEGGGRRKRQRTEQAQTWNVTRTTKTSMPTKDKETPLWARTADAAKQKMKRKASIPEGQQRLGTKEVIELSDDEDQRQCEREEFLPGFSSDALAPPSCPIKQMAVSKEQHSMPTARSSSPAFLAQRAVPQVNTTEKQAKGVGDLRDRSIETDKARSELSASVTRRHPKPVDLSVDKATEMKHDVPTTRVRDASTTPIHTKPPEKLTENPPDHQTGQTLRLTARSSKKKTLLCQDQLAKKATRTHSANKDIAISSLLDVAPQDEMASKPAKKSQRQLLEERLAKIPKKSTLVEDFSPSGAASSRGSGIDPSKDRPQLAKSTSRPQTAGEDNATALAELDQMIMPPDEPSIPEPAPRAMPPPLKQDRHLRKVVSDVPRPSPRKRAPGAPMRFTPSPSRGAQPSAASAAADGEFGRPTTALPPKARGKKPIQRSVSLNTTANGTSAVIFSKPFQTPKAPALKATESQKAPDPWSREAFDLFTWRPPGWDEEKWCRGGAQAGEAGSP